MKTIAFVWLVFGLVPMLRAQNPSPTTSPTLPAKPFLERAPTFSQWTVTSKIVSAEKTDKSPTVETPPGPAESTAMPTPSSPGKGKRLGKQPKEEFAASPTATPAPTDTLAPPPAIEWVTTVTKTASVRCEHVIGGEGENIDRWCFPGIQVTVRGEGPAIVSLPNNSRASDYIDYSETDFDGFQWISEHNFKGVEVVNDQECYTFRDKVTGLGGPPDVPSERVACINTATRLPVTLKVGDELRAYRFGLAPTAMLKPPEEVTSKVEQWRTSIQQSVLMPAKP